MRSFTTAAVVAAALPLAFAQTSTDCDPTKKTCPNDTGLPASTYSADFTTGSSANASWSAAAYTTINYGSNGAEFSIINKNQAPTVQTDFYIFFGRIEVKMKAAPGQGIVSSIVLESDDLDEIDWEFLGGNTAQVETNFFGKGNTTSYDRATYYPVTSPQTQFHTYTVDWNSDRIQWIIDGVTVRTLAYDDPSTNGGNNYPQTPMRLKLGNWCGGCDGEPQGTVEWAGGKTTFGNNPYVMYVEEVSIQNYNPADSYTYGDKTGSWQSIKMNKDGTSSNPSGSAASVSVTPSATGVSNSTTAASSGSGAQQTTAAPTSSLSVGGVNQNSGAVVSTTKTGSSYSMNTASASAQNVGNNGTMATSVVGATTEVPGSTPTGSSNGTASGSSGAASQTGTSGASTNAIMTIASLLSIALGFLML